MSDIKIITIVGARPQIIKAATLSRIIKAHYSSRVHEVLVHTGQHYHDNMSDIFFKDIDILEPKYNLGLGGLESFCYDWKNDGGVRRYFVKRKA